MLMLRGTPALARSTCPAYHSQALLLRTTPLLCLKLHPCRLPCCAAAAPAAQGSKLCGVWLLAMARGGAAERVWGCWVQGGATGGRRGPSCLELCGAVPASRHAFSWPLASALCSHSGLQDPPAGGDAIDMDAIVNAEHPRRAFEMSQRLWRAAQEEGDAAAAAQLSHAAAVDLSAFSLLSLH